jgi:hypothetical protein
MIAFNDREYLKYAPFTYELTAYDAQQYLSKKKKKRYSCGDASKEKVETENNFHFPPIF